MSKLLPVKLEGTTDASGDATITSEASYNGLLHSVQWIDGDFADGVDGTFTVTNSDAEVNYTVLTLTDANDDAMYYPRAQVQDLTGAGITYDGTNEVHGVMPPVVGKLQLVIAQGGDTKTGGAVAFLLCD